MHASRHPRPYAQKSHCPVGRESISDITATQLQRRGGAAEPRRVSHLTAASAASTDDSGDRRLVRRSAPSVRPRGSEASSRSATLMTAALIAPGQVLDRGRAVGLEARRDDAKCRRYAPKQKSHCPVAGSSKLHVGQTGRRASSLARCATARRFAATCGVNAGRPPPDGRSAPKKR